jgi:uncharacterized protein (DUF2141 family)
MKKLLKTIVVIAAPSLFFSFSVKREDTFSLKVEVNGLRNSDGHVQFVLYDTDGSIPDEDLKNYSRMTRGEIHDRASQTLFRDLPPGKYAVNIFHDENNNGRIDKGLLLPKEGIGFSNYETISLRNRPSFRKASFDLDADKTVKVKIIYM